DQLRNMGVSPRCSTWLGEKARIGSSSSACASVRACGASTGGGGGTCRTGSTIGSAGNGGGTAISSFPCVSTWSHSVDNTDGSSVAGELTLLAMSLGEETA